MVLRRTRNLPDFHVCPQIWVKPRKWSVSGFPSPCSFRPGRDGLAEQASPTAEVTATNSCPPFFEKGEAEDAYQVAAPYFFRISVLVRVSASGMWNREKEFEHYLDPYLSLSTRPFRGPSANGGSLVIKKPVRAVTRKLCDLTCSAVVTRTTAGCDLGHSLLLHCWPI